MKRRDDERSLAKFSGMEEEQITALAAKMAATSARDQDVSLRLAMEHADVLNSAAQQIAEGKERVLRAREEKAAWGTTISQRVADYREEQAAASRRKDEALQAVRRGLEDQLAMRAAVLSSQKDAREVGFHVQALDHASHQPVWVRYAHALRYQCAYPLLLACMCSWRAIWCGLQRRGQQGTPPPLPLTACKPPRQPPSPSRRPTPCLSSVMPSGGVWRQSRTPPLWRTR